MRFMMIMYPGPVGEAPAALADEKEIAAMMRFNEELARSGALLSVDGLHPSSAGARLRYQGGKVTVTDGPFTEAKELIGGFWIIQVKSKEEAVAWARKIPAVEGQMVELRQVVEMSDFDFDASSGINERAGRLAEDLKTNRGKA